MNLLCDHEDYFEKCNDCGETGEEIQTAAIEAILRDAGADSYGDIARKIYELVHQGDAR